MFVAESTSPEESYPWNRGRIYRLLRNGTEIGHIELALLHERGRATQIYLGDQVYAAEYERCINHRDRIRGLYRVYADGKPVLMGDETTFLYFPIVLEVPPFLSMRKKFWGQYFIIQQADTNRRISKNTIFGTVKQVKGFPYRAILETTLELNDLVCSFFIWISVANWHAVMEGERDA